MKENAIQSDYKAFRTFTTGPPSKWISAKPKAKEESDSWKFDWDEKLDKWEEERTAKWEDKPDVLEKRPMKWEKRNGKLKKKGKRDKWEKKSGAKLPKTGAGWIKKVSWVRAFLEDMDWMGEMG